MNYNDLTTRKGFISFEAKTLQEGPLGGSILLELARQGVVGVALNYKHDTETYEWLTYSPLFQPVLPGQQVPTYDLTVDIDLKVTIEVPAV